VSGMIQVYLVDGKTGGTGHLALELRNLHCSKRSERGDTRHAGWHGDLVTYHADLIPQDGATYIVVDGTTARPRVFKGWRLLGFDETMGAPEGPEAGGVPAELLALLGHRTSAPRPPVRMVAIMGTYDVCISHDAWQRETALVQL
jgi:hypothetical protein